MDRSWGNMECEQLHYVSRDLMAFVLVDTNQGLEGLLPKWLAARVLPIVAK